MKLIPAADLQELVRSVFLSLGSSDFESGRLAHYLVESNLTGHDSHGVIRVPEYVDHVKNDRVRINQHARVIFETDSLLVVDGGSGFGQVIGEEAMQMAIHKNEAADICVLALRNCGHLGRIGDWPMMAAQAGNISLHFVNTSGLGLLVAPFGGIDRRLSANPIAVGIPRQYGEPIILDISTCAIAEGKLKVARNQGNTVAENCIIDAQGQPTIDPRIFYANPPGAIKPFGGHKGYGLGIVTEIFAGAVTGSGCSKPGATRLHNGMLAILLSPERIPRDFEFASEVEQFVAFVKSSRRVAADQEILMPGELEARTRADRLANGIPLDTETCRQLRTACSIVGVSSPLVDAACGDNIV
jgi:uncharacterized oxidoreductase